MATVAYIIQLLIFAAGGGLVLAAALLALNALFGTLWRRSLRRYRERLRKMYEDYLNSGKL